MGVGCPDLLAGLSSYLQHHEPSSSLVISRPKLPSLSLALSCSRQHLLLRGTLSLKETEDLEDGTSFRNQWLGIQSLRQG
jgi:hypothetical protein